MGIAIYFPEKLGVKALLLKILHILDADCRHCAETQYLSHWCLGLLEPYKNFVHSGQTFVDFQIQHEKVGHAGSTW